MDLSNLIDAATHEFKQKIIACGDKWDQEELTPELAEQMTRGIKEALAAAGVAALQTFLESYEVEAETLECYFWCAHTPCALCRDLAGECDSRWFFRSRSVQRAWLDRQTPRYTGYSDRGNLGEISSDNSSWSIFLSGSPRRIEGSEETRERSSTDTRAD